MNESHKMTPEDYAIYGRNVMRWFDVARHPHWPGPLWHNAHIADSLMMQAAARVPARLRNRAALELDGLLMLEQLQCLADPNRVGEALAMVDDWESRMAISSTLRGNIAAWLTAP